MPFPLFKWHFRLLIDTYKAEAKLKGLKVKRSHGKTRGKGDGEERKKKEITISNFRAGISLSFVTKKGEGGDRGPRGPIYFHYSFLVRFVIALSHFMAYIMLNWTKKG